MRRLNLPGMTISAQDTIDQEMRDNELLEEQELDQDMNILDNPQSYSLPTPVSIDEEIQTEADDLLNQLPVENAIEEANEEVSNPYTDSNPQLSFQDKLKMLQDAKRTGRMTSDIMSGAGMISDAVARGYGGQTAYDPKTYGKQFETRANADLKTFVEEEKSKADAEAKERKAKLDQYFKFQDAARKDQDNLRKEAKFNMEKEMGEPTSEISILARQQVEKSLNRPIPENITAKQLKEMGLGKQVDEFAAQRAEAMMLNAESRARMAKTREKSLEQAERRLDLQKDKFGYKRNEDFDKDLKGALKDMRQTETFKMAEKSIATIPEIEALLDDAYKKGGQSLSMLGPKIAKGIAGEVGVLTDQDVTRYVKNPQLTEGLTDDLVKLQQGKISEASYENIKRLLDISKKVSKEKLESALFREAQLFTNRENARAEKQGKDPSFTVGQAYNWLNENVRSPYKDGKVKMVSPTGTIVLVPSIDVTEALEAGGRIYEPEIKTINPPRAQETEKEKYRKMLQEFKRMKELMEEEDFYE